MAVTLQHTWAQLPTAMPFPAPVLLAPLHPVPGVPYGQPKLCPAPPPHPTSTAMDVTLPLSLEGSPAPLSSLETNNFWMEEGLKKVWVKADPGAMPPSGWVGKGTALLKEVHLWTSALLTHEQVRKTKQVRSEDRVFVVLRHHSLMGTGGVWGERNRSARGLL